MNPGCRILDTKPASDTALPAPTEQSIAAEDEQESERSANGGWPFQRVADQLVANLLDANWQVRHGAAVGLRQLLRTQASSAAVQVPIADALTGAPPPLTCQCTPTYRGSCRYKHCLHEPVPDTPDLASYLQT